MIKVGSVVRSFDFAAGKYGRDLEGERACYVEGVVEEIGEVIEGCPRYKIRVTRDVFGGEEKPTRVGTYVFPPINGTPTMLGRVMESVEVIDA